MSRSRRSTTARLCTQRYARRPLVDGLVLRAAARAVGVERFAVVFRDVWRTIPAVVRGRITRYWERLERQRAAARRRRAARGSLPGRRRPRVPFLGLEVESLEFVANGRRGRRYGDSAGLVSRAGAEVRFLAPLVERLPLEAVAALVAHEFGHLAQYAVDSLALYSREAAPAEHEADGTALGWGYNLEPLDKAQDRLVERWRSGLPVFRPQRRRKSSRGRPRTSSPVQVLSRSRRRE